MEYLFVFEQGRTTLHEWVVSYGRLGRVHELVSELSNEQSSLAGSLLSE